MGQGHSQAADEPLAEPGPATTEPGVDPEERARVQAEVGLSHVANCSFLPQIGTSHVLCPYSLLPEKMLTQQ